jgi:autotransporter-associated beta strand protein
LQASTGGNDEIQFGGAGSISVPGKIDSSVAGVRYDGTGTLTLSNSANAYTGATTITAGTLAVMKTGSLGDPSAPVVLDGGATMRIDFGPVVEPTRNIIVNAGGGVFDFGPNSGGKAGATGVWAIAAGSAMARAKRRPVRQIRQSAIG